MTPQLKPIDGPLMDPAAMRANMVKRMARDLVARDAFHDAALAINILARVLGYPAFAVLRLVDDARQVAMQDVVAREMSEP